MEWLSSFRIFIRKRPSPYTGYRQSDPTEAAATPEILLILSDDWEKIKDILKRRGGLLLQADAGCGKTWVAKNIAKNIENVKIIAPTNKAALNMGGTTYYS